MNLSHRIVERVKLSTSLAISLEFTLEAAEDVVESDTALAGRRMIPPMRLHRRATLAADGETLTIGIERVTGPGGRDHVSVAT